VGLRAGLDPEESRTVFLISGLEARPGGRAACSQYRLSSPDSSSKLHALVLMDVK
jgi:hypothetical protein